MSEKFEVGYGESIYQTAERAVEFCKSNKLDYTEFAFNGLEVVVSKDSSPYDIVRIYNLLREVDKLKNSL